MMRIRKFASIFLIAVMVLTLFAEISNSETVKAEEPSFQSFQLVAVQWKWDVNDYASPTAFKNKLHSVMQDVVAQLDPNLPALVCFPEFIGLPLLFVDGDVDLLQNASTFADAIEALILRRWASVLAFMTWYGVGPVRALFLERSGAMQQAYLDAFKEVAATYNVYIVGGSIAMREVDGSGNLIKDDNTCYNLSYFFGPDGKVLGWQKKVHLTPMEQYKDEKGNYGLDLNPGTLEELKVFSTPFGEVSIAICYDAFFQDVIQTLAARGGGILVQPSANPKEWDTWQQEDWLNGCWQATREPNGLNWFVNPMMVGLLKDITFEGQSSIGVNASVGSGTQMNYMDLEPIEGFLAIAETKDQPEIVVQTITTDQARINYALNKPATASGNQNSELTPEKAVDGAFYSRWASRKQDNEWWKVDLGSVVKVKGVTIWWERAYAKTYSIQVSTDDVNYTTVYSTTSGDGGVDTIWFEPVNARYIKVLCIQRVSSWYPFSFWEAKVYNN
ncbi:hypothetical protein CDSM653_00419 [Caldanaerobacter subterraneus subsp. pacificus DSM 12653]|uniref:CN hydrolase domain-containing protein n=2 Tax=Caldanaerobacter subterraneus TaxID=911092 RepID=B7R7J9_9THEO|nr:hypothetical protein CDSM653_00419 [Caldanaerobacter subterraneus subsp. pacificus DSM 12653]